MSTETDSKKIRDRRDDWGLAAGFAWQRSSSIQCDVANEFVSKGKEYSVVTRFPGSRRNEAAQQFAIPYTALRPTSSRIGSLRNNATINRESNDRDYTDHARPEVERVDIRGYRKYVISH